jgi:hypothetical protein
MRHYVEKQRMQSPEADMKMEAKETRLIKWVLACLGLVLLLAQPALAQIPVDDNGDPIAPIVEGATPESFDDEELPLLSVDELEAVVGPVALYPDDLLAIVLPASTYPLQVVQAARFLEQLESDPSLKPDEEWDESITALLNYPEVVELMNDDIDWTWRLGEAVVAQQADVIAAIEVFRDRAYAAGNLKTDEYQTVSNDDGVIEIEPASEDIIYVPYYEPERVVVYQPGPVYYYYPRAYPVYYYPYPYGYSFATGYFWGVTTAFTIGWATDHLHVYHHSYWGHPYYGRYYDYHYYYRRPSLNYFNITYVQNSSSHWNYRYRDGDYWRPRRNGGARPGYNTRRVHYYRDRNRDDWSHQSSDHRRDGRSSDRRYNNDTSLASNRTSDYDSGSNRRGRHDRNATARRESPGSGTRLATNRTRNNPADRRARTSSTSTDSNAIRFRPRNARASGSAERNRTRASEDLNRSTSRRSSFAASTPRPATASENRRPGARAANNVRQQASRSAARQARIAPSVQTTSRSAPSFRKPSARTQPQQAAPRRSTPQRSAPQARTQQRSAPSRSAAPSSQPRSTATSKRQSESRSSRSNAGGSSKRSGGRRQKH